MSDVTQILHQLERGDAIASEQLLPLIYDELRKLAAAKIANERSDHTLQATALVHEAYVRVADREQGQRWDSRGHFFAAAAEAMRRILVESARSKARAHRGLDAKRQTYDEIHVEITSSADVLALNEALSRLESEHPIVAEVVKLRYFAGLTIDQSAKILRISVRTANRHWAFAKAWLFQQLET